MDDPAIQGQKRGEDGLIALGAVLLANANGLVLLPGRIVQKGKQPLDVRNLSTRFIGPASRASMILPESSRSHISLQAVDLSKRSKETTMSATATAKPDVPSG